jgi:hypothetical protein
MSPSRRSIAFSDLLIGGMLQSSTKSLPRTERRCTLRIPCKAAKDSGLAIAKYRILSSVRLPLGLDHCMSACDIAFSNDSSGQGNPSDWHLCFSRMTYSFKLAELDPRDIGRLRGDFLFFRFVCDLDAACPWVKQESSTSSVLLV